MTKTGWIASLALVVFLATTGVEQSTADAQRLAQRESHRPLKFPSPFPRITPPPTRPQVKSPLRLRLGQTSGVGSGLADDALRAQRAGDMVKARKLWFELMKRYPRSPHVPSAYLAFGDYYFAENVPAKAMLFYRNVVDGYPNYRHIAYVHFMVAWTHHSQGKFQDALQGFQKALQLRPAPALELAIDEGLVLAYSRTGHPNKAHAFFHRVAPFRTLPLLEKLAYIYHNQGQSLKAMTAFGELIVRRPNSKSRCNWQLRRLHSSLSLPNKVQTALEALELNRVISRWRPYRRTPCGHMGRDAMFWVASKLHLEAHKAHKARRAVKYLPMVPMLYAAYIKTYPSARFRPHAMFFRAEALWGLARMTQHRRLPKPQHRRMAKLAWLAASAAFSQAAVNQYQETYRVTAAKRAARMAAHNASLY